MARIFITGSADGLGKLSAKALIAQGHQVVAHARNDDRASDAKRSLPKAEAVVIGDLSHIDGVRKVAQKINTFGTFDAVIHNAGVYQVASETIFNVNTLAPYILTCLINKPNRLIYLSSGMHLQGRFKPEHFQDTARITYSDSKLHVLMLAMAVSKRWPDVYANVVDPGWVPTKMGGSGAPDNLHKGFETQVWLAASEDKRAQVTGQYFYHQQTRRHNPIADDPALCDQLLAECEKVTGVSFPV